MKKITLIRHGSLETKYDHCYIGKTDLPLSQKGLDEAVAAGRYLARFQPDAIYSSPMLRGRQTVENALQSAEVIYDPRLCEIDFGVWEEKTFTQISQWPREVEQWASGEAGFAFPDGEKLEDFRERLNSFKTDLLKSSAERIFIFTHGGVILELICDILGLGWDKTGAFKVDRGSVSELDLFENGLGVLTLLNCKNFSIIKDGE